MKRNKKKQCYPFIPPAPTPTQTDAFGRAEKREEEEEKKKKKTASKTTERAFSIPPPPLVPSVAEEG